MLGFVFYRFTAHGINNFQKTFFAFIFMLFTVIFSVLALINRENAAKMVEQDDITETD